MRYGGFFLLSFYKLKLLKTQTVRGCVAGRRAGWLPLQCCKEEGVERKVLALQIASLFQFVTTTKHTQEKEEIVII